MMAPQAGKLINSQLLYQLSYCGIPVVFAPFSRDCAALTSQ